MPELPLQRSRRCGRRVSSRPSRRRLEDTRRDRRAGDRHAQRLVDLARLDRGRSTTASSAGPTAACSKLASCGERRAGLGQHRRPSAPSQRSRAAGSSTGPSNRKPASGQKSARVWIFSWLILTAAASPERPVNASRRAVSSCSRERADVDAVQPLSLTSSNRAGLRLTRSSVNRATSSSLERTVASSPAPQPSSAR